MKTLAFILAAATLTTNLCLAQLSAPSPQLPGAGPQLPKTGPQPLGTPPPSPQLPGMSAQLPGTPASSPPLAGTPPASPQQTELHTTISSAAATTAVEKLNIHWLAPVDLTDWRNDREPVEGLSPQSWTTMAGWHPGQSAFPDNANFSTEMPLLWLGHEPWQ
jgi:hypothetical protein